MSRSLPADVAAQIGPMPTDFSPTFEERNSHVRWAATLEVTGGPAVEVELGYSRAGADAKERANLRTSAWQAMELARLGRRDLLDYCAVGRHKRR